MAETIWFEFKNNTPLMGFGVDIEHARVVRMGKNVVVEHIDDDGKVDIYTVMAKSVKHEIFKSLEGERLFVEVFRGLTLWGYGKDVPTNFRDV